MERVIEKMFARCFTDKKWKQAIGVALESRRLDKVRDAIESSNDQVEENLGYTFTIAQDIVKSKKFRTDVLRILVLIYQKKIDSGDFDHYKIAKCQFYLNMPESTAAMLEKLCKIQVGNAYLDAYQIAFDICDKENQTYQREILELITKTMANYEGEDDDIRNTRERLNQLVTILKGEIRDRLYLQFLKKNNYMDPQLIVTIKKAIGPKSSILHGATIWANGMMNAYTTNDTFLNDNLSWVAQATNWNRFNATASLGIIHGGNKKDAEKVLEPYFSGAASAEQRHSPYTTAGAYFAYGLIHQNQYSPELVKYFLDGYSNSAQNEAVQHGVSLGLGLVGMATQNQDIFNELKQVLYKNADSAIIGEAAAYGMGLVMVGAADQESI